MQIDLCLPEFKSYLGPWRDLTQKIGDGTDRLRNNYTEIDLREFLSFTVICDDESKEIQAFSGLQKRPDRWGENSARILSRYYIVPSWRHKLNLFNSENVFGFQMFSAQIKVAKKNNLTEVFLSRETHPRAFAEFVKHLNESQEVQIKMLEGRHDVCGGKSQDPSCFQYIAKLKLDHHAF